MCIQDQQLLEAVRTHGTNWSTISSFHTPKRTPLALKNQYWKIWPRIQKAGKTSAAKTSPLSLPEKPLAANNILTASDQAQSASTTSTRSKAAPSHGSDADDAEGNEDEDEDVDMDVQSDEGETHGIRVDIRASLPAEYAEAADAGATEWFEDWTNLQVPTPRHMLISSKEPDPLAPLWTDLDSSPMSVVPQGTGCSMPQLSAAISVDDEMYFSFMEDLQTFEVHDRADQSSITDLITPVSTSIASSTPVALAQTQPQSRPVGKAASAPTGTPGSWPSEVRSNLRSVSVKFSCPVEEVSNIMALVAGTGLNAVIKIDSEEFPVGT